MKTKRFSASETGYYVGQLILSICLILFGVIELIRKEYFIGILVIVFYIGNIVYETIRYIKRRKHSNEFVELDDKSVRFVGCASQVMTDGNLQYVGNLQLGWDEIDDVFAYSHTLTTKTGEVYTAKDEEGWVERNRVWKTMEKYFEAYGA